MATLLDRTKMWRRSSWDKDVFLQWNIAHQTWIVIGLTITPQSLIEDILNCDDLEEYQPDEPELEWRASGDGDTYRLMNKGIAYGRPATEAELRSIRRSLGIKE